MRYPLAIHKDTDSGYGVTVPDIPGCFSAGATIDEAIENASEAVTGHLELLAEDGVYAPVGSSIEALQGDPDYAGVIWSVVDVDISLFLKGTKKVSVTLPKLVIAHIETEIAAGRVKSRSTFLADAAIHVLRGCKREKY